MSATEKSPPMCPSRAVLIISRSASRIRRLKSMTAATTSGRGAPVRRLRRSRNRVAAAVSTLNIMPLTARIEIQD
jgi:hypothetical protein